MSSPLRYSPIAVTVQLWGPVCDWHLPEAPSRQVQCPKHVPPARATATLGRMVTLGSIPDLQEDWVGYQGWSGAASLLW